MTVLLALAIVVSGAVQYEPAQPTVGDLVAITFPDPGEGKVSLIPDESYEVVEIAGARVVVRSFRPGTIRVVGEILTPGQQTQRHTVEIEIRSVLAENDDLQPAPLVLPKPLAPDQTAWWAIGIAAVAALAAWLALWQLSKRMTTSEGGEGSWSVDPAAAYLERLNRIARLPDEDERWRQLADATRWILPRVDESLGPELTTSEVLGAMRIRATDPRTVALVDRILHGGDWAKFSPFGAPDDPLAAVLESARSLASLIRREEAA